MSEHKQQAQVAPIVAGGPKVRLIAKAGNDDETSIDCRRVVTLIGSREGCKIRLRHSKVAAVHAAIVNDGTHVFAADLVSRTGTLLNGLKVEQERLTHGDMLAIHPWDFRVEIEDPQHDTQSDIHPLPLDHAPQAVSLEHIETGRVLYPNRDLCTIGRRSGCDIVVPDNRASRVHTLLINYFGHPAVYDLLSHNHTWINDEVVTFHMLKNDDVLMVGDSSFRVRLIGSAVVEQAGRNGNGSTAPVVLKQPEHPPDEIDIEETESSQTWRIADSAAKAARSS